MGVILEFLFVLVILAIVGFYVGISVLIYRENPKVSAFLTARPVLGWPIALVTIGGAAYITLGVMFYAVTVLILAVVGHGQPPQ